MKIKFSLTAFYAFVVIHSFLILWSDFISIVFIACYFMFITAVHFREALRIRIRLRFFMIAVVMTFILPFIYPDKILVFDLIPISIPGLILAVRFSLRLMLFYVFFELFSFVFSPRVIMLELSTMGLHKLGIITGIAYNQFYYLIDLMYSVWRAIRQRRSGIPGLTDLLLFLRSLLRHSLRRADNIAFSMYATGVFDTMPVHSGIIFKKKDIYLLLHLGVVLAVLAGVFNFS